MNKENLEITSLKIPAEIQRTLEILKNAGHEAYIVGGCVRDLLRRKEPKDWDVTTSARPEEILALFPESFYENKFLTVTVKTGSEDPTLGEIEITTFRAEGKYTDKRHPDEVRFAKTLEEDLSRRDFTINAMALEIQNSKSQSLSKFKIQNSKFKIHDPFGGQEDLKNKLIRAVGEPEKRFEEDALRMMRAVRLAAELDFEIEPKTQEAIKKLSENILFIAKERIRDELIKILKTRSAKEGIELLHELGLLRFILPELEEGIGVENRPKIFTVWEHNLKALEYGAKNDFPWDIRLAALLHDVGKPRTRGPQKNDEWTFYGHDVVGARVASQILERLRFPRDTVEKVATLIRWHLFKYDPAEGITDSSIRRLIRRVGAENMNDLVKLRICDRMGMGVPKALPYRLRHFQFRVEKILREEEKPTPKMLKVNGDDVMRILGIPQSIKVGRVLEVLLQEVIDDPSRNTRENLELRIKELANLSDEELIKLAKAAEEKVELMEDERISRIKAKYYVK
jgi:poly(A) polymerase/tRNA nucleotidyltransferase (CCA-adding enzyme)